MEGQHAHLSEVDIRDDPGHLQEMLPDRIKGRVECLLVMGQAEVCINGRVQNHPELPMQPHSQVLPASQARRVVNRLN